MKKLDIINAMREIVADQTNRKYDGYNVVANYVHGLGNDNIRSASTISAEYKKYELQDAYEYFFETVNAYEEEHAFEEDEEEAKNEEDCEHEDLVSLNGENFCSDCFKSVPVSFDNRIMIDFFKQRLEEINREKDGVDNFHDFNELCKQYNTIQKAIDELLHQLMEGK